ncbi:hypothetical protein Q4577_06790 [Marinovum sp. 2_MG-2023]|uniref:hypothetical protein n=1 Tax=unclassified Marinovum TaxID=2647166 RepID=UPI0026E37749|nr:MULTISPECIES: hypothetical protein [unclassified Marinovum]MDO6729717.1 hypothetical protein [Marinovum sp. 2_MG-2023]MDO6779531.1 hypothetical protein [Marinovum sp. 1_MG-2023]
MLAQEVIPKREPQVIAGLIRDNLKTVWLEGKTAKRGQHGKHHGLVEGRLRVRGDLPDGFAVGVFQPGQTYRCLVRFSNGGQTDDRRRDVRGMAIKLLDVPGQKLLPGRGPVTEQDFILVDHPTYFTATMAEYVAFNRYFTPMQDLRGNGITVGRILAAGWGLAMLWLFHRKTLRAAREFAGRQVGALVSLTYHSTTAFLCGDGRAVKYKVIGHGPPTATVDSEDGLRQDLWRVLAEGPAQFDFGVVVQADAEAHPIEDPTVDWGTNGADFIKLADLTLFRQSNAPDRDKSAETMRFNPWMSLPAHCPLGFINRARREIYRAMSDLRRHKSGRP